MSDQRPISIGTIREKTVDKKDGSGSFTFLEIDLKQNVELYVNGEKVNFSTYEANGKTLANKRVSITPVEIAISGLEKSVENGNLSEDLANDIRERYENQNVRYTLSVAPRNLA